jgi:hypothetical protein
VISVEPSADCVLRLLHSLKAAGVAVPRSAEDGAVAAQAEPFASLEALATAKKGVADKAAALLLKQAAALRRAAALVAPATAGGAAAPGASAPAAAAADAAAAATRASTTWVFQNAATDAYTVLPFEFVADNPGASFVPLNQGEPWMKGRSGRASVGGAPLDDLLPAGARDPAAPLPPSHLPAVDPARVRLVKVSAEGFDARAVHGLRRLLSVGAVPFVIFVFNDNHVKEHGCSAEELVGALVDHGYRMWHAGIFYARAQDVALFIRGQSAPGAPPRSTELVFVGPGATWA